MKWTLLCCVALCGACSAQGTPGQRPDSSAAASAGQHASVAGSGSLDLSNSVGLIQTAASAGNASTGGAGGDSGIPAGCEPGKFCAPTSPDPTNCGTLSLKSDVEVQRVPGNLLVVFDQSLSMAEPWGLTGQTKIGAAQTAIANAIESLKDSLSVGALFFPTYACLAGVSLGIDDPMAAGSGPDASVSPLSAVAPIDGEGQIAFQPAPQFLNAWQDHWSNATPSLGVGTPLQEAFDRADAAISGTRLSGALAVVAVTDGAPTCFPAGATDSEPNRAKSWLDRNNVKTYVVGLPGADGVQLLNDIAAAGGTTEYLLPDDPQTLENKLKEVVQQTVKTSFSSCSINLTPAADPADKLLMVVIDDKTHDKRQVPHVLSADGGWTITPDGKHVEITGSLCNDAKAGRFASITFEYPCKDVPPPPPIDLQ
jgi:hypothetical protein